MSEVVDWLRDAAPAFGIGRSGREIKTRLTEAADLLDYYTSVVEGLTEAVERFLDTQGRSLPVENGVYEEANAIRNLRSALQHAQSKAEPGPNNA